MLYSGYIVEAMEHVNTAVSTMKDPLVVVLGSLLYFISTIYLGLLPAFCSQAKISLL